MLGGGGGSPKGLVHKLLMQFLALGSSNIEVSEACIVTTQDDHPSYVKHFLGSIYVLFTLFGYWVRGGGVIAPVDSLRGGLATNNRSFCTIWAISCALGRQLKFFFCQEVMVPVYCMSGSVFLLVPIPKKCSCVFCVSKRMILRTQCVS